MCSRSKNCYPEYAGFLIINGISNISFSPDTLIKGNENDYI